jgi:hypothetical protein
LQRIMREQDIELFGGCRNGLAVGRREPIPPLPSSSR